MGLARSYDFQVHLLDDCVEELRGWTFCVHCLGSLTHEEVWGSQ